MKYKDFHFRIPQPEWNFKLKNLLPTPGNVIFTLLVLGMLYFAQSVGALPGFAPSAAGTSTGTIAYQGRLADTGGTPLTNTYNMIFRLYSTATGGAPLWEEQWTGSNSVKVSDGLFNVMLGSLTPIPQNIITGNDTLYLGITVGTDNEMSPRVQLGSVPFAVQALTVPDGSITGAKIADGSVTQAKLDPNVTLGLTEITGTYTATFTVTEGVGTPTMTPNKIRLSYRRIGSMVFVSMPGINGIQFTGNPHLISVSLPFPLATVNEGGAGVLTHGLGGTAGQAVGVIAGTDMTFRDFGVGYDNTYLRGGFWYIAQ